MNKDKLSVLKRVRLFINNKIEESKQRHEESLQEAKKAAVSYLETPMSDADLYSINLISNIYSLSGINWTEKSIKLNALGHNAYLFSEEEYQYYYDQIINSYQKVKW